MPHNERESYLIENLNNKVMLIAALSAPVILGELIQTASLWFPFVLGGATGIGLYKGVPLVRHMAHTAKHLIQRKKEKTAPPELSRPFKVSLAFSSAVAGIALAATAFTVDNPEIVNKQVDRAKLDLAQNGLLGFAPPAGMAVPFSEPKCKWDTDSQGRPYGCEEGTPLQIAQKVIKNDMNGCFCCSDRYAKVAREDSRKDFNEAFNRFSGDERGVPLIYQAPKERPGCSPHEPPVYIGFLPSAATTPDPRNPSNIAYRLFLCANAPKGYPVLAETTARVFTQDSRRHFITTSEHDITYETGDASQSCPDNLRRKIGEVYGNNVARQAKVLQ